MPTTGHTINQPLPRYKGMINEKYIRFDWADKLTHHEVAALGMRTPKEIFPEHYIIRVHKFNDMARPPLEE